MPGRLDLMIKAVLFDFDGTLVNTNPLIIRSFRETFAALLPDRKLSDEDILDCIGPTLHETGTVYLPDDPQSFVDHYRKLNVAYHDSMILPYPGITEMLDALKTQGISIVVVSSKKRDMVMRGIEVMGMNDYFDWVFGGDDVKNPKPHPEVVELALSSLGIKPEEAIMVGDNFHDIHAAQNAGVLSVGVGWAHRGAEYLRSFAPSYLIRQPMELVEILNTLNS